MMTDNPKVSIIIPSDSIDNLRQCIHGIVNKTSYKNIEIIVVTNSKTAEDLLNEYPYLEFLKICNYDKVYNFSDKCNKGAKMATGQILAFYNDDVVPISRDWIERQIEILMYPMVGGVSPLLLDKNNNVQYAGMITGTPGLVGTSFNGIPFQYPITNPFNHLLIRNISVLCGACMLIKKEVFEEIEGFDAIHTPNRHSDVDLSFKLIEKGYQCVYTPYAILNHLGNHSWEKSSRVDKADIFCLKRWGKYLTYDPYFTKNMKKMFYLDFTYRYEIYSPQNLIVPDKEDSKDILFLTHELTRTGAPVVLKDMVKVVLNNGEFPVVLSPVDGPLKQEFLDMGVTVIIDESAYKKHWMFENFVRNFDLVVANTLGCADAINLLINSRPPILWWVHEGRYAMKHFAHNIPKNLRDDIKIFCVSQYVQNVLYDAGLSFEKDTLQYGIDDYSKHFIQNNIIKENTFVIVGSIEERKGQDILLNAIELLPQEYKKIAKFIIIGNVLDNSIFQKIQEAMKNNRNIKYLGSIPRDEVFKYLLSAICLIVPSRDDPLPVVVTECMMFSKVCICSNNTGTASLLKDGVNGLIFKSGDATELAEKIMYILNNPDKAKEMGKKARLIYEEQFTKELFETRVKKIINDFRKKN